MRVAEGVLDRVHPAIGQEVVMHDDAVPQIRGDVAALFARAIESEGQTRRRVQPVQLAGDPIARLIEAANLGLGHAFADGLVDFAQFARLLAHPGDDAGRTDQRRAEQIVQRLRDPILGDELMDVEINRRRLDTLAILGRRDHAIGKLGLRHAPALRAMIDRSLMFRDQQRTLGKIEHLAFLDPNRRHRIQRRTAMAARAGLVPNHGVGIGDLTQRAALMALLAPARLARAAAQAARHPRLLLQPVARWRFRTLRTVQTQSTTKFDNLRLKRQNLGDLSEAISSSTSAGRVIPPLNSEFAPLCLHEFGAKNQIHKPCGISDSLGLGSYATFGALGFLPALRPGDRKRP